MIIMDSIVSDLRKGLRAVKVDSDSNQFTAIEMIPGDGGISLDFGIADIVVQNMRNGGFAGEFLGDCRLEDLELSTQNMCIVSNGGFFDEKIRIGGIQVGKLQILERRTAGSIDE